jgi:hypothetical protein
MGQSHKRANQKQPGQSGKKGGGAGCGDDIKKKKEIFNIQYSISNAEVRSPLLEIEYCLFCIGYLIQRIINHTSEKIHGFFHGVGRSGVAILNR